MVAEPAVNQMTWWARYSRRLKVLESDYGRECGWYVECEGKVIAVLTEPRFKEMFWDSYRLEVFGDDATLRAQVLSEEFWAAAESKGIRYRSIEFGSYAEYAYPALSPFLGQDRIVMRGLYIDIGKSCLLDRAIARYRRWLKSRRG